MRYLMRKRINDKKWHRLSCSESTYNSFISDNIFKFRKPNLIEIIYYSIKDNLVKFRIWILENDRIWKFLAWIIGVALILWQILKSK